MEQDQNIGTDPLNIQEIKRQSRHTYNKPVCEQRMLRRACPNETSNHGSLHYLHTQKRRDIDENVSQNVTHLAKLHYIAVQICIN